MTIVTSGEFTITDTNDGLSANLTQTAILIPTEADGTGGDYSLAQTTITVTMGGVDVSSAWTFQAAASLGLSGVLAGQTFTISAMTSDVGYVDFSASSPGQSSITARVSVVKARRGFVGPSAGIAATAAGFTFKDGVAFPVQQQIALTLIRQNITAKCYWFASNGANLTTDEGQMSAQAIAMGTYLPGVGDTCYIDISALGSDEQFYVTAVVDDVTVVQAITKLSSSTAEAGATRNIFRGTWITATVYVPGDIVLSGGSSWLCIVQHTSSGIIAPPTLPTTSNTYWTQYASKGDRGTIQSAVTTAGSVWSDTEANAAIVAAGGVAAQRGDVVTLYNSATSFSQTRVFTTGGSWALLAAFFGGDVLVDGTVVSSKVAANAIISNHIAAGAVTANHLTTTSAVITGSAQIADAVITSAKIADLAVGTLKIAGRSVIVPETATGPSIAGNNTFQVATSLTVALSEAQPILIFWTIEQSYAGQNAWNVKVRHNGTDVYTRAAGNMVATTDFPGSFLQIDGAVGANFIELLWLGTAGGLSAKGRLVCMGVLR